VRSFAQDKKRIRPEQPGCGAPMEWIGVAGCRAGARDGFGRSGRRDLVSPAHLPLVHHVQEKLEQRRIGLLDLIEQDDVEGHVLGLELVELLLREMGTITLLEADVARRRAN
jgi:hypothetical protein